MLNKPRHQTQALDADVAEVFDTDVAEVSGKGYGKDIVIEQVCSV